MRAAQAKKGISDYPELH